MATVVTLRAAIATISSALEGVEVVAKAWTDHRRAPADGSMQTMAWPRPYRIVWPIH